MKKRNAKTLLSTILLSTLCYSFSNAQSGLSEANVEELLLVKNEVQGTYQIQMINTRSKPTIPLITFEKIKELRDSTEVIYYELSSNSRIKILPYTIILNNHFKTPESVIFINSREE